MEGLVGRTLGQYQIVKPLGGGGMATVYLAVQPSLNRSVAVKVLPPGLALDPTFRERFRREATAAANLKHPNILPVFDFGEQGGLFYIVTMYVEGGTLADRVGRISLPIAYRIVGQVAGALDYAHQQGIVHRDLKPSNILLSREDWALLTDFGIAQLAGRQSLTDKGAIVGTAEYMSPEQAQGESVDLRSDLYSLGIVLFQLVAGRVPFTGDRLAVLRQHVQDPLPRPSALNPAVSPAIEAVILQAAAKDRGRRFATAEAFRRALEQAANAPAAEAVETLLLGPRQAAPLESTAPQPGQVATTVRPNPPPYQVSTAVAPPVVTNTASPAGVTGVPRERRRGSNGAAIFAGIASVLLACLCLGTVGALIALQLTGPGGLSVLGPATATPTPTATATSRPVTMTPTPPRPTSTPTRPPAATPTFTPIPVAQPLFLDDLTSNRNGWALTSEPDIRTFFQNNTFNIINNRANVTWLVSPLGNRTRYASFVYEADLTKVDGPDDRWYGVHFRTDSLDGYSFLIRGDGVYQLTRFIEALAVNGNSGFDRAIEPTQDQGNIINRGSAKNRLKVAARGTEIVLYVNDRYLDRFVETKREARSDGTIGVATGSGLHVTVNAIRVFATR